MSERFIQGTPEQSGKMEKFNPVRDIREEQWEQIKYVLQRSKSTHDYINLARVGILAILHTGKPVGVKYPEYAGGVANDPMRNEMEMSAEEEDWGKFAPFAIFQALETGKMPSVTSEQQRAMQQTEEQCRERKDWTAFSYLITLRSIYEGEKPALPEEFVRECPTYRQETADNRNWTRFSDYATFESFANASGFKLKPEGGIELLYEDEK